MLAPCLRLTAIQPALAHSARSMRQREGTLTSFNIFTFSVNTPTCSSFWLSSSSSTDAEYWPLEFGVALLKVGSTLPRPLPLAVGVPFAPGYAPNEGPRWSVDEGGVYPYPGEAP